MAAFTVRLLVTAPGTLAIPPLRVDAQRDKEFLTPPLTLTALPREGEDDRVVFRVIPSRKRVWRHQPFMVTLRLDLRNAFFETWSGTLREDRLEIPWIAGNEGLHFLELSDPPPGAEILRSIPLEGGPEILPVHGAPREGGRIRLVARVRFLPVRTGSLTLEGAAYRAAFEEAPPLFERAEPVAIEVLPLPREGRPEGFTNGVGVFAATFAVRPDPAKVRLGDTLKLELTLEGEGNLEILELPKFAALDRDFRLFDARDDVEPGMRRRTFHLAPRSEAVRELPELAFAWFDPEAERYVTAVFEPKRVFVLPGDGTGGAGDPSGEGKDSPASPKAGGRSDPGGASGPWAWLAPILVVIGGGLCVAVWLAIRRRGGSDDEEDPLHKARESLLDLLGSEGSDPGALAMALACYLEERFDVPRVRLRSGRPAETLRSRGLAEDLAREADACFAALDAGRFAKGEDTAGEMAELKNQVKRFVEGVENSDRCYSSQGEK